MQSTPHVRDRSVPGLFRHALHQLRRNTDKTCLIMPRGQARDDARRANFFMTLATSGAARGGALGEDHGAAPYVAKRNHVRDVDDAYTWRDLGSYSMTNRHEGVC